MSSATSAAQLLWTGGWDSTFRLMQLLLVERTPVQPHYLEDPTRKSTKIERATMDRIIGHLHAAHPQTRSLLLPLRSTALPELPPDPDINVALRNARKRIYIGSQYAWLSSYCKYRGIENIELCVHLDDKVHALLEPFLDGIRVDARFADSAEYALFRYFSFPLFRMEKVEMGLVADSNGWGQIMDMTWFCHTPVRDKPCGVCGPCVYTIQEGLGHRVPRSRRVLSFFFRHLALPLKPMARRVMRTR